MRAALRIVILVSFSLLLPVATRAQANPDWHRAIPGFKIAGNLYYVGTADLAVYLIATPEGNILINGDFKEDVPAIRKSIEGLGFKYADTKIILISHAHGDHDEGVGLIKSQTGARLMVMDADVAAVESTAQGRPGAKVDRVLHDRDTVQLGGSTLTARLTPGHTPGCTTWTMQLAEGGRMLNAVIIGSPNVNAGYVLVNNKNYPQIAGDYVKTFALLKTMPVDLFLGAHGAYFNLKDKLPRMGGSINSFVDPAGYQAYVAERERAFENELTKQTAAARTGDAVGFDIAWDHVALSVPNIAETIAWYEKMLGFKGTVRGGQPGARQQVADLRRGNITIELFQLPDAAPLPESRKNPSEDFRTHGVKHFGFEVKNLPAVLAELKAKGVKMAFEMRDTPTTAFAFISDNAGNAIELIEHKGDSGGPQATPAEIQTFEAFRAWLGQQPANVQQAGPDDVLRQYAEELRRRGKTDTEIPATIATLRSIGDRAEIERWNRILTAPNPTFNTEPNAFLVAITRGLKPGRSLDVGMGQGRNTIFLAQQGWDSHGFDPAERAVAAAQEQAGKTGVKITTAVTRAEEFDWGAEQWDLIVLSYVGARGYVANVAKALRRGGMVIVEGFHRDATKEQPIGGGVVFDSGELPKLFDGFRIVRYEEPITRSDFGRLETKIVRLAAVKP